MEQFEKVKELLRSGIEEDLKLGLVMMEQMTDLEVVILILINPQLEWSFSFSSSTVKIVNLILRSRMMLKSELVNEKGFTCSWTAFQLNGLHTIREVVSYLMILDKEQLKFVKKCT